MMKLYREHVLKEQPSPELVQLGGILPAAAKPVAPKPVAPKPVVEEREEVGSFGD